MAAVRTCCSCARVCVSETEREFMVVRDPPCMTVVHNPPCMTVVHNPPCINVVSDPPCMTAASPSANRVRVAHGGATGLGCARVPCKRPPADGKGIKRG